MPAPHQSDFYGPGALPDTPNQQRQSTEGRQIHINKWRIFGVYIMKQLNICKQVKLGELFHCILLTQTADLELTDDGGTDVRKTQLSTYKITNTFIHCRHLASTPVIPN